MKILKWTAFGMRPEGIGTYVELRDYQRLQDAAQKVLEETTVIEPSSAEDALETLEKIILS